MKSPVGKQALIRLLGESAACCVLLAGLVISGVAHADPTPLWIDQIGSDSYDYANGVATDTKDNAIVAGTTYGSLVPSRDNRDAWVAKYNALGVRQWIRQFGTDDLEYGTSVATDSADNIFVAGYSTGDFGGTNKGGYDAFVAKFNTAGTRLWVKLLGSSSFFETANGVAADTAGNVYICGETAAKIGQAYFGGDDAWLAKYNAAGVRQWVRQLGTSQDDVCNAIAVDKNNKIVLTGTTYGPLGGPDPTNTHRVPWIAKYTTAGALIWVQQVVSNVTAFGESITTDKNANILVGGTTYDRIAAGGGGGIDAWVAKYKPDGSRLWIKQYGTRSSDSGTGVAVDPDDNVLLTGKLRHYPIVPSIGAYDAFVRKFSAGGAVMWTRTLDSVDKENDGANAVATDSLGTVYIAGDTEGELDGQSEGRVDAFIAKYTKN